MTEDEDLGLNKIHFLRHKTTITKLVALSFISLMMFGLTTLISLINNPHMTAYGALVSPNTFNLYVDHYHLYHSNIMANYSSNTSSKGLEFGNDEEDCDYEILATIGGEDAKKLLNELHNGKGIHFRVSSDESGADPIVYLYKS